MKQVRHDLNNLVDFTVAYYDNLLKKYGKGRERKTEMRLFEAIQAQQVAIANVKLYVNRAKALSAPG
jgi:topoisomerase-4 subunit A